jgi:hypothetical protein
MTRLAGFLAVMAVLAFQTAAHAQQGDGVQARLSAMSFAPVDKGQTVEVRLYDDSDDNKAIKAALEKALADAGYRVAPNARYALSFEATNSLTANKEKRPTVFSVDGHKGSYDDEVEARIKLFSTGEDSVIKPRPDEGPQGTAGSVRLDAGLIDRQGGKRLWQGWAMVPVSTSDTQALARSLAVPLMGHLGQAVRDKHVPLAVK